jgi:hypothetical protein
MVGRLPVSAGATTQEYRHRYTVLSHQAGHDRMTDRHIAYIVVLDQDIREDDAVSTINALAMVKGVAEVKPVIGGSDVWIAQTVARTRLRGAFMRMIQDLMGNFATSMEATAWCMTRGSTMPIKGIPEPIANSIWAILVAECGASDDSFDRSAFVQYLGEVKNSGHEYRFMGKLGTGGKFYNDGFDWHVDCYKEDTTPERTAMIVRANDRLRHLWMQGKRTNPP